MARYTGSVCKLCRREQTKLFLKGEKCFVKCVLERHPNPPGRIPKRRSKLSEYALRLREKQKLRHMAGMLEGSFRRFVSQAERLPGATGETLLRLLEMRLDNVVRRSGFATSPKMARQLVLHGHILVNGKALNIPSCLLRPGDFLELKQAIRENVGVKLSLEAVQRRNARPAWMEFQSDGMKAKVLRWPSREEMSFPIREQLIVEHYSK